MSTTIVHAIETTNWRTAAALASDALANAYADADLDLPPAAVLLAALRADGWDGVAALHASVELFRQNDQTIPLAVEQSKRITNPLAVILDDVPGSISEAWGDFRAVLREHHDEAMGIPDSSGARFDFDAPAPATPWLVPGLLVRGSVHLMTGREHTFKTGLWDAAMIASLTTGRLLDMDVKPLRWLRVDAENPPRKIHERWAALGFTNDQWDAVRLHTRDTRVRLAETTWQDWLRRQIEDHEPDVIVLDTVSRIWFGMDANANDQIVRVFDFLQPICDEYNTAIVLPHHQRKSGGRGDDAVLGGVQWQGQADQTMTVAKTAALDFDRKSDGTVKTTSKFALARAKGRDMVDPAPMHFAVSGVVRDDRLVSMAVELPNHEPSTVEQIVAVLAQPLGTGALAQAVDLNRTGDKFRTALAQAVDGGQIVKNDDGLYERGEASA